MRLLLIFLLIHHRRLARGAYSPRPPRGRKRARRFVPLCEVPLGRRVVNSALRVTRRVRVGESLPDFFGDPGAFVLPRYSTDSGGMRSNSLFYCYQALRVYANSLA